MLDIAIKESNRTPIQRPPPPRSVDTTIVNGTVVYANGQIVADAGIGCFVRPVRN